MFKGGRLYVTMGGLRRELLKETHDTKWAGHLGEERTMALLSRSYYFLKMDETGVREVFFSMPVRQD